VALTPLQVEQRLVGRAKDSLGGLDLLEIRGRTCPGP
jgi:hypothetical protein